MSRNVDLFASLILAVRLHNFESFRPPPPSLLRSLLLSPQRHRNASRPHPHRHWALRRRLHDALPNRKFYGIFTVFLLVSTSETHLRAYFLSSVAVAIVSLLSCGSSSGKTLLRRCSMELTIDWQRITRNRKMLAASGMPGVVVFSLKSPSRCHR